LLLGAGVLSLLLAGGYATVLLLRPHPITQEDVARITEGMTQAEVEAVLGVPGVESWVDDEGDTMWIAMHLHAWEMPGCTCLLWHGEEVVIFIDFDSQHRVANKHLRDRKPRPMSFWNRLRRLLRL
jgi:hypothetical protein